MKFQQKESISIGHLYRKNQKNVLKNQNILLLQFVYVFSSETIGSGVGCGIFALTQRICALNKSPSIESINYPFCNSTKERAIFNPNPLPSVERELSPLTKRSINSSGATFNCSREIFLTVIQTLSSFCLMCK